MHLVAPVLQQLDDGAAGDAGQNGAHAGGGVDLAVDLEHDVHGADFLDVLLLNAVQPQHLGEAALLGQLAGLDGRGVVAAALRKAGQSRGGTDVLILNIDADGVEALGVVGTGGCADDGKAVMLGGVNAQAHIGSDAERTDVQGRAVGVGHPVAVHIDQRLDRLHKVLRRDGGHAETVRGIVKTVRVAVGAEQLDLAVRGAVGLHALKNFLCVVEHSGSRVHLPRAIGDDAGVMPALARGIVHQEHVVAELLAEAELRLVLRLFLRMGRFGDFNVQHNFTLSLLYSSAPPHSSAGDD